MYVIQPMRFGNRKPIVRRRTDMSKRDISDILYFRGDLSPFLVHLTRTFATASAKKRLRSIVEAHTLVAGDALVSHATFGYAIGKLDADAKRRLFSAVCFTEMHCLLEIRGREVDLAPYGLVFLKDRVAARGVSPVLYLNNTQGDKDAVVRGLDKLIDTNRLLAESILPLVAVFGKQLQSVYSSTTQNKEIDFLWEREWRYPASAGDFKFSDEDVFVGLCPDDEIAEFESLFSGVKFIDPTRNVKWYASKLIAARQRLDIKYSVV